MNLLKWLGNKRYIPERYAHILPAPETITGYREPFLGSGAVAEHYLGATGLGGKPLACWLSDANADLIAMYRAVRDMPETVIGCLRNYTFDRGTYEMVRAAFNSRPSAGAALRAAWFIYLNRTCFNGLYRVNRKGEFNVPMGDYKDPTICDPERILECSRILQHAHLAADDFATALDAAQSGEFVFLDPPYVAASSTANFTGYAAGGFGRSEQETLAEQLDNLDAKGCRFLLTNADTPEARELYDGWRIERVEARRSVSAKGKGRGMAGEILVANYDLKTVERSEAA